MCTVVPNNNSLSTKATGMGLNGRDVLNVVSFVLFQRMRGVMTTPTLGGLTVCAPPPNEIKRYLIGLFGLCDAKIDVTQLHKPFIVVRCISLKAVGLWLLSKDLYLALLRPHLSIMRLRVTVSRDLKITHIRHF